MRVLLVENDALAQGAAAKLLAAAGHDVHAVGDGSAALDRLQAECWDALVLDLILPGTDGFAVLETGPLPPVVVVTTALGPSDTARIEAQPGLRLLRKPFQIEELLAALTEGHTHA